MYLFLFLLAVVLVRLLDARLVDAVYAPCCWKSLVDIDRGHQTRSYFCIYR